MPNVVAIGQIVAEIWRFFDFCKTAAAAIFDFLNLEILAVITAKTAELRRHTKFRGDWSNCCGYMATFRFFRDGGRPPSWGFQNLTFLQSRGRKASSRQIFGDQSTQTVAEISKMLPQSHVEYLHD